MTRKGVSRWWGIVALQSLIVALWGIRLMLGLRITSLVAYEFVKRRGSPPSPTSSPLQRIPDAHFTSRFFLLLCCLPHISPLTNTSLQGNFRFPRPGLLSQPWHCTSRHYLQRESSQQCLLASCVAAETHSDPDLVLW